MTTWNKTGLVVGTLSRVDLINLIRDSEEPILREHFATWITLLEGADEFVISLPYKGKQNPTVEE